MMRVCTLPEFATRFQNNKHEEKKVVFDTVDGGPNKNPRYEKTVNCSTKYFVENGLDPFFFGNKCSCCYPCNRVEHRMVKLSKKLSGVTLKHDKFGIHLDGKGVTVDKDLELKNFEYAGCTLAKIWSGLLID